ncbi:MAG TPA: CDP-alcohol phosphatidyltransferase family protein [Chitinophagaceae bacterium]|nr:CDP-alcohol phosphatidyltransferase family protein [Chitinophagaceae bacterium]
MSEKVKTQANTRSLSILAQVPNLFTLLNLVFGCIAIIFILQTGETIVLMDNGGATQVNLPERIWWGSLFIFAAATADFLDGFLARMLRAHSELGKQLDSLGDVVSFGVAPAMILYQLLRIGYAQEENGLDVSMIALMPAFIYAAAAAWRLAKFNLADNQSYSFRGVPTPAAGLLIASFPLIIWYQYFNIQTLFINKWLLYAVIFALSYLMICNRTFMAIKFTDFSYKNNLLKYLLLSIALVAVVSLKWLAVPIIFIIYLIMSVFSKVPENIISGKDVQNSNLI